MTNPLRKKRHYTRMRQKIIQAALHIMQHRGVDALSLRALAHLVDMSPANVYEYFLNKEEVILSAYDEVLCLLCKHLYQIERTTDTRTDLLTLSVAYVDFIRQSPAQIPIISQAFQTHLRSDITQTSVSSCNASIQSIYDLFVHAVACCLAENTFQNSTQMTASEIAHAIWTFTHGMATFALPNVSMPERDILSTALDAFLDGLS